MEMPVNTTFDGQLDIDRGRAQIAEWLPAELKPLADLAFNYRWSWMQGVGSLFREIDLLGWGRSGCNPRHLIERTPPHRLKAMAADPAYVARVQAAADALAAELARPPADLGIAPDRPVAYFCAEFGVHCSLPLYGGGLGVLAGDLLKAASDLRLPMVGTGLLYREGYFNQRVDPSGWQHEYWTETDVDGLPAVRVTRGDGEPITVEFPLRGRPVVVQVWRIDVGRIPLYLLDTDHADNHPIDRWITSRLYVGDRQTRLAQYAVLGIGGARALDAMGIQPAVIHLNEGHAALGGFDRIRQHIAAGMSFDDALAAVRTTAVFTTHTPVAAGNEGFAESEIEPVLGEFIDTIGIPREAFFDLGRLVPGRRSEPANLTPLALNTSHAANGVSRRHGEVARHMWQPLWPERTAENVPISHITNGVHTTTWMSSHMQAVLDRHLPADWRERAGDDGVWKHIADIPDVELWQARCAQRRALVAYLRDKTIRDRLGRGEPPEYIEQAAQMFDPDVLTVGFARRVATYKRLYLLTRQPDRSLSLLADEKMPLQLIVAGKAHPQDDEAKASLRDLFTIKAVPVVGSKTAFLENYDLHVAPRLVAGVDVWLNLPRPPLEASGTSGMKVVLNGGLNVSVLDGWWAEAYNGENGWAISTPASSPAEQDDHDAAALVDILQTEVLPLFYHRDADGLPHGWLHRVRASMRSLCGQFSAHRMVGDYVATMYR
jgi:starch phosphorylase